MSEELKPCPFCGGDVRNVYPVNPTLFDNHFLVICQQCGCIGPFSDERKNGSLSPREFQEKAVTAWNTRVEQMVADEPDKEIVCCKDCKRSYEVINGLNELQLRCKHWLDDDTPYIVVPNGFCAWGERKEANDGRI